MTRVALSCAVLAGCAHAPLPPLPPVMTPDERLATYEALHPQPGEGASLVLANGVVIDEPDEALAVVPSDGPAARTAHAYVRARRMARVTKASFVGGVLGGLVLMPYAGARIGMAMIGAGFLVAMPAALVYSARANRLRARGLVLYEDGLRQRLELCPTALRLVPCETLRPAATPTVGLGMRAGR